MSKTELKSKNVQAFSLLKPKENEKEIFLHLLCVDCKTHKSFKITESLKNMLMRNSKEIAFSSKCEKCNKTIGVMIGWK